jgi:hypothetical protein
MLLHSIATLPCQQQQQPTHPPPPSPPAQKPNPKSWSSKHLVGQRKKSSIEECDKRSQNPYKAAFIRIKLSGSKLQEQDSSI